MEGSTPDAESLAWSLSRPRSCQGRSRRAIGVFAHVEARAPCQAESSSNVIASPIAGISRQAASNVVTDPISKHALTRSINFCRESAVGSKTLSGLF